jgi:hypothetical protein
MQEKYAEPGFSVVEGAVGWYTAMQFGNSFNHLNNYSGSSAGSDFDHGGAEKRQAVTTAPLLTSSGSEGSHSNGGSIS